MKNIKKICLGVGLAALLAVIFMFIPAGKTLAATTPDFNLRFSDSKGTTITGKYNNKSFTFKQLPAAAAASTIFITSDDNSICKGSYFIIPGDITVLADDAKNGTNIDTAIDGQSASKFQYRPAGSAACQTYTGSLKINPAGGGTAPPTQIVWSGAKGSLSADGSTITVTFSDKSTLDFSDKTPSDTTYNFKPSATGALGGVHVTGWCSDTILGADTTKGITLTSYNDTSGKVDICYYTPAKVNETATVNVDVSAYVPPSGGTSKSCLSESFTSFEWVFCPVLKAFDSMIGTLTGIIEKLLDFNVHDYLNPQVKNSWSIMKNIASSLLVIIMLIAIISQAIGGGPFDAYTLRKLIPRLVAAVILIQLSWYLLIWVIEIVDDLGYGVRDLLCAPFGGWQNLDLAQLVKPLGIVGTASLGALFTTIGIAYLFSGLTIFGVLLMALSAVLSDLLAFVLLILRQVFVVLAVIMFPIAMILWILPGTQRYWKLWFDNFTKILMLFPMIMALIYGGRIFAHVFISATASSSDGDKTIATFVLLIGYFGPYFFLPRAFKWGGQLFSAASSSAFKATEGFRSFPRKYATGAAKENRTRRGELRAARLADNPNNRRFANRLLAGEFNFAKARGRGGQLGAREMQFAKTLAQGEKESRESVPAQLLRSGYDSWRHGPTLDERGERILEGQPGYEINKLDANQAWLEGRTYAGITPDAALRGHAFDTLVQLGDPDRIRMARQNSEIPEEIWSKATARNFPKLNEIARYLTLSPDLSNLAVRQFSTQDDDTVQELVRQLDGHYIYNRETGGRVEQTDAQHHAALQRAADLAADARNPLIWVDLGQTKKEVISQIEARAAAEGIVGRSADTRRRESPDPTPPPPTPPTPPEGPGPEDDESEIDVDHGPEV